LKELLCCAKVFLLEEVLCTRIIMTRQSKTVHKKSRGRPIGRRFGETIPARFEPAAIAALDGWAVAHGVSRSEAIRRLVELGLKAKGTKAIEWRAKRNGLIGQ
jgi:hypothetical protein